MTTPRPSTAPLRRAAACAIAGALAVGCQQPREVTQAHRAVNDYFNGDFPTAIKSYSTLIDKRPGNPELHNVRGIAYAKAGDKTHADQDFAAARKGVVSADRLNNLCYEKAMAGVALDRALEECEAALKSEPDVAPTLDSKGFVLLRLGKIDESIALFDKALAKSPTLAPSLYGRAIAWSRKGDKAKAQADRDAALKIDPTVERRFDDYGVKINP